MIPLILGGIGAYLVGSELTKKKTDSYKGGGEMAKGGYMNEGGVLEHGLKKGDEITQLGGYLMIVKNNGKYYKINISQGTRVEVDEMGMESKDYMASGGKMAKGGRSMNVTSDTHFGATGSPRTKEKEKVLEQYRTKKFFSVPPNTSNLLTDDEIEEDFFVWADKKMSFSGNKEEQRGIKVFSNNYFDTYKTHEENLKKYKSVILGK